jgi:hypothetical protein
MSFSSPSHHPWIVCPFFTTLAFMRQGINGDQAILPLAEHFIRLTGALQSLACECHCV